MKFLHYDLGHLERGDVVVATLKGDSVNVRLLDQSNLSHTVLAEGTATTEDTSRALPIG